MKKTAIAIAKNTQISPSYDDLKTHNSALVSENEILKHNLGILQRALFGTKSEKIEPITMEQLGLLSRLILVGIKAIQADPHCGNASLTGNHLRGCAQGVAKLAIGKLGAQWRTGAKLARGLDDLAFDLENMRERRVAALRR